MIGERKAIECAKTLEEYCEQQGRCGDCIFYEQEHEECRMDSQDRSPNNWELEELEIGEYYEINTPFLDTDNDYLQFYVKQNDNELYFTDDGYTINTLETTGFTLTKNRKKQLLLILNQYGVQLNKKELILKASVNEFPQKKHAFTQCLLHVSDLYMTSRTRVSLIS